jgi:hypothetical protein
MIVKKAILFIVFAAALLVAAGCDRSESSVTVTASVSVTICSARSSGCAQVRVPGVEIHILSGGQEVALAHTDAVGTAHIILTKYRSLTVRVEARSFFLSRDLAINAVVPDKGDVSVDLVDPEPLKR